jgi:hypothetical protein
VRVPTKSPTLKYNANQLWRACDETKELSGADDRT